MYFLNRRRVLLGLLLVFPLAVLAQEESMFRQ